MEKRIYNRKSNAAPVATVPPVKVGDVVRKSPVSFELADFPGGHVPPSHGRVAWVHPQGRYYMVEFSVGQSVIRECFGGVRA